MSRTRPIFFSALILTGVNLLLRAAGTSFHVYLSRQIGAEGLGLLQLVMSVGNLAMVAGIAGVRTAAMYLTAEELGKSAPRNVDHVLSSAFLYSILCSAAVSVGLFLLAPLLAQHWIGDPRIIPALRIFAVFLPVVCLCGVMSGYFTAANWIGTLAAVEVAEQLCAMAVTFLTLTLWADGDSGRACACVILGSSIGACVTLTLLVLLRVRERAEVQCRIPIRSRLLRAAVPLALADVLRSGISTTENLLVPKRLALCRRESNPLGAFGRISGMVFPVMMFPACILFALAELLIPELARCNAAGNQKRIQHLVHRGLWAAMLYGVFFSGLIFLFSEPLCSALYKDPGSGVHLRRYALMIPFLYCDAITDAMTKGLGQQKQCVKYNILTSGLDVLFLFFLLPRFGMAGYYVSFLVTHLLNFCLSLRHLCRISACRIPFYMPALASAAGLLSAFLAALCPVRLIYIPLIAGFFRFFGVFRSKDAAWLRNMAVSFRRTGKTGPNAVST